MSELSAAQLAQYIDHTVLKTDASPADIAAAITEARELGTYAVCFSPNMLPVDAPLGELNLAAVVGFPSGKHLSSIKAAEAAAAVAAGANEIDMVIDIGALIAGDVESVENDIRAVRDAIPSALLKVIIESAALNDEQIEQACRASMAADADYVKTSTGFHPAGGASAHAVRLMRSVVGDALGVKASGGIRTWDQAIEMIEAGASRLGVSGTRSVLGRELVGAQSSSY